MSEVEGKVVAITEASSGIGATIAVLLAARVTKVVLGTRPAERLKKLVDRIQAAGEEAVYAITDVRRRGELVSLVELA